MKVPMRTGWVMRGGFLLALLGMLAGCSSSGSSDSGSNCDSATSSTEITAVRQVADGAVSLSVTCAVVTYLVPAVGSDPAGFTVQAPGPGPALFIAVDPSTLNPQAEAGQLASFTVTTKATANSQPRATAIGDFAVLATGYALAGLVQNASNLTDLISNLDGYDAELISVSGTVESAFASAGTGFVSAQLGTTGISGNPSLKLRLPSTIRSTLGLAETCTLTVGATPLWRLNSEAQPAGWTEADFSSVTCDLPQVVSASATSDTSVNILFDKTLDPASILADGSQFTFDNGLVAAAATASGMTATVVTGTQTTSLPYTVTVANTVKDSNGAGVDETANSAMFNGF